MSLPAAHVAAKPSPRWEAIQHRFPSPPPAINTPDVNGTLATCVHTHICRTLEQLFASLDNATSNTMLSPVERNDQVSKAGATALGLMNELDNAYTVAGGSLPIAPARRRCRSEGSGDDRAGRREAWLFDRVDDRACGLRASRHHARTQCDGRTAEGPQPISRHARQRRRYSTSRIDGPELLVLQPRVAGRTSYVPDRGPAAAAGA